MSLRYFVLTCIPAVQAGYLPWTSNTDRYKGSDQETNQWIKDSGVDFDPYLPEDDDFSDKPTRLFPHAHSDTNRFPDPEFPKLDALGKPYAQLPWEATFFIVLDGKPGGAKEKVTVRVHPEWAPEGAKRFQDLIGDKALDGTRFYRVLKNNIAQFGIPAKPEVTEKWDSVIPEDDSDQTNKRGTLSFAMSGPDTRTTQMFFNLRNNGVLDGMNYAPFAEVLGDGMQVVDRIQHKYGQKPDQEQIMQKGEEYLRENFPELSFVESLTATFAEEESAFARTLKIKARSEEV